MQVRRGVSRAEEALYARVLLGPKGSHSMMLLDRLFVEGYARSSKD